VKPFLRWAGGKRWIAPRIAAILTSRIVERYYEPFLGSAALFFQLLPPRAVLSDINRDLTNCYDVVRRHPDAVVEGLRALPVNAKTFYRVRLEEPADSLRRAVRFLYLNRTCYGGLHRTNRDGRFNTPYGGGTRTPEALWRDGILLDAARQLARRGVQVTTGDFESSLNGAGHGDVVYCDPIYTTQVREQFDRYNSQLFDWTEQVRLSHAAHQAASRGALVLVSNAYSRDIRSLYRSAFRIPLERKKAIGNRAIGANRGVEYLIILDPLKRRSEWRALGPIEQIARATPGSALIAQFPSQTPEGHASPRLPSEGEKHKRGVRPQPTISVAARRGAVLTSNANCQRGALPCPPDRITGRREDPPPVVEQAGPFG
jgi:DNA adenine methylase